MAKICRRVEPSCTPVWACPCGQWDCGSEKQPQPVWSRPRGRPARYHPTDPLSKPYFHSISAPHPEREREPPSSLSQIRVAAPCAAPPNSSLHLSVQHLRSRERDSRPAGATHAGRHGHFQGRPRPRRAPLLPPDDRGGDRVAAGGQRLQPGRHRAPHRGGPRRRRRPPAVPPRARRRAPLPHVRRRRARRGRRGQVRAAPAAAVQANRPRGGRRRGRGRGRRLPRRRASAAAASRQARSGPPTQGAPARLPRRGSGNNHRRAYYERRRTTRTRRSSRRAAQARPPAQAAGPARPAQDRAPARPAAEEPTPGRHGADPAPRVHRGQASRAVRRGRLRVMSPDRGRLSMMS